jgi:cysteinyl-tRNA synthetase
LKAKLLAAGRLIGHLQQNPNAWLKGGGEADDSAIADLVARRQEAKKSRNFAEADRIRDELKEKGVVLEDKPGGRTEWRRAG